MTALILVDIQNDFLPGGALAVPFGDEILPVVQSLLTLPFDLVIATKDYHPEGHISFAKTHGKKVGEETLVHSIKQRLWPVHCVQGTNGADFEPGFDSSLISKVIEKGTDPFIDSYSTFFDNEHLKSTGLEEYLKSHHIKNIFVAGLATDYCVLYSVLDALSLHFNTYVVKDGCRGVNIHPDDSNKAFNEMHAKGAHLISSSDAKRVLLGLKV